MEIDLDKNLQELEGKAWALPGRPERGVSIATVCYALSRKPLIYFEIEDLRMMISQNLGLEFLIPLALQQLREDVLAEGAYYPGDLLMAVLNSDVNYWLAHKKQWKAVDKLFYNNMSKLNSFGDIEELRANCFEAYHAFKKLHE